MEICVKAEKTRGKRQKRARVAKRRRLSLQEKFFLRSIHVASLRGSRLYVLTPWCHAYLHARQYPRNPFVRFVTTATSTPTVTRVRAACQFTIAKRHKNIDKSNIMHDSVLEPEDEPCDDLPFGFSFGKGFGNDDLFSSSPTSTLLGQLGLSERSKEGLVTENALALVDFFQTCYETGDASGMASRISSSNAEWKEGSVTIHGRDEIEKHLAKQWSTQLNKKQSTRLFVGTEKRVVMTIERSWEDAENIKHKESGVACWELDANGAVVNRVFVSEPNLSARG